MSEVADGAKGSRKKFRPTYSCLNCHKRKVKCDRVKPCSACCLRGTPSECEYGTSKQDRHYIHQSALIESLMQSCQELKVQLAEARRAANLPLDDDPSNPNPNPNPQPKSPQSDSEKALTRRDSIITSSTSSSSSSSSSTNSFQIQLRSPLAAKQILEVLVGRLINAFSPIEAVNCGSLVGLRDAAQMRVFSPLLSHAFEAASLTFVGRQERHLSMEKVGHVRYTRVLRQLQQALNHPEQSKSTEVLVVVLLFIIIEAFKQSSKDAILRHQLGGLGLLRSRTPFRHRTGIERSMFVDLRLYWVTAALIHRRPSFMATPEWLSVPWPADGPPKDILHLLLDIAVEIPAYLAQIDEFSEALKTNALAPSDLVAAQTAIWEKASELDGRLHQWKALHADTYPGGSAWEVPVPSSRQQQQQQQQQQDQTTPRDDDNFPIFQCRNLSTMQIVTPPLHYYPDILLSQSMCFYWAVRLVLSAADSGVVSVSSAHERYVYACHICRSMKYYVLAAPGCLASRMMFILRVAFDTFADGMMEKRFIETLFAFIGHKLRLTVFTNQCSESAVKVVRVNV
ncbi:hypothetical protein ASPZODRAFT_26497 [Penicilliopsis zonata CBS 506.65]|uniref:Zn(2)-C6 fungal-type domain-containing protein n=1 Tax=Penicilliopsis zonata CBS 506.65 TaxID=1073090 RepID=A0A1L9SFU4_9EURO|nr:hypothetical protein ASPZODRAFT_26497 [Penicilliopsis zonata CBS 506.65]OJJ45894.1 hypothetical protein ASPZODRAFT_26497 [Penicilliopsis zonata CBS 506.65]